MLTRTLFVVTSPDHTTRSYLYGLEVVIFPTLRPDIGIWTQELHTLLVIRPDAVPKWTVTGDVRQTSRQAQDLLRSWFDHALGSVPTPVNRVRRRRLPCSFGLYPDRGHHASLRDGLANAVVGRIDGLSHCYSSCKIASGLDARGR